MSEDWKQHDRPCPPCEDCGTFLYEKFWGNGGWTKTDMNGKAHSPSDCVVGLRTRLGIVRAIYKKLIARGGDSLTYGEWAQIGDAVDPIPPVAKGVEG